MAFWQQLLKLITFQEPQQPLFILGQEGQGQKRTQGQQVDLGQQESQGNQEETPGQSTGLDKNGKQAPDGNKTGSGRNENIGRKKRAPEGRVQMRRPVRAAAWHFKEVLREGNDGESEVSGGKVGEGSKQGGNNGSYKANNKKVGEGSKQIGNEKRSEVNDRGSGNGGKKKRGGSQEEKIDWQGGNSKGSQGGNSDGSKGGGQGQKNIQEEKLSVDLESNLRVLKNIFHLPENRDIIFRDFSIDLAEPVKVCIIYVDGLVNTFLQNISILQPLMLLSHLRPDIHEKGQLQELVEKKLLPGNQVETAEIFRDVVDGVLAGSTAVLIDHTDRAIIVESKGWEHRTVERPVSEMVVRGSQEAFTETFRVNTALVRKALRSPYLVTEISKVGTLNRLDCAVMYLEGVANPQLIKEVKRRLSLIRSDFVIDSGHLEQFIEDSTFGILPQILSTERPDRVVSALLEGKIAVLLGNSPFALVMPSTFLDAFQTSEDTNLRWPFGSMIRVIRLMGLFFALFLPALYLVVTAYHPEVYPTDLLLAVAASRENVPFPTIVEVIFMEFSFELIREAGLRIPGVIGPTLGIVGALILGQAAVAANIVSPILIILVAITALGNFTIPSYSMAFNIRLLRFIFIILGAFLGIFGIILGLYVLLLLAANLRSFGVPTLLPFGVYSNPRIDTILRKPIWVQEERPDFLQTLRIRLQPKISRRWIQKKAAEKKEPGDDYGRKNQS